MHRSPRIVVLGGGTGSFTLLQGIKKLTPNVTAIVNMSDDGGSTGTLRDELGVLPPGDLRQCLVALSDNPEVRNLFGYRFDSGRFKGQSLGNIILSGLELQRGNVEDAVRIAGELLHITGTVLPVTLQKHRLMLRDGWKTVAGEDKIGKYSIRHANPRLWLNPASQVNLRATEAIMQADLVVVAPGNFYRSLVPICLVQGVAATLQNTPARVVMVANLVNKPGHTNGWHVVDYVQHLEKYLGEGVVDLVLYNSQPIKKELLKTYALEGEFPVDTTSARFKELNAKAIGVRLVDREIAQQDPADTLLQRTLIRHDPKRVVVELEKLFFR
jgi:uncharacterized cofD-like protein